ncbi:hypothetical protein Glove_168g44 [Diversispora epigaea]|uniref:Galactose oxidase n=1 Tax=Diversispora epigaea TaxID=1348612 RepID=A0A397IT28_9GLOM|nr:hypothetical protein Glove_168g44 [Diversispora epigaea]
MIINDTLLILGGDTNTTDYEFELFYLDLSKKFDNYNLTWTLIENKGLPVYVHRSTSVLSLDNSTVYLIGGLMQNRKTKEYDYSNLVYTYDYPTSKWSAPVLDGDAKARQNIKGVIDDSGNIYIFGGFNATNLTSFSGEMFNDMNVLNTVSNTWTTLSIFKNLPLPCSEYTANILPNGTIIYIGGLEQVGAFFTLVDMKKIKLFDTHKHEWSQMNATGEEIDSRIYFSSVLTPDGHIIIFGGISYSGGDVYIVSVSPKLATLDTNKNPFIWSIPYNSEINAPPSIYGHTADLYYDYMIITFGSELDLNTFSSQEYFYNIKNNKWVTTFIPLINETPTQTPTQTPTPTPSATPTPKYFKWLAIGFGIGLGAPLLISCVTIIIVRRIRGSSVIETVVDL